MADAARGWVVARVVPYLHDAVRLRERLADSAIDARLPDEATARRSGSLGGADGMRIEVRAADLERARNIIDDAWDGPVSAANHPPGPLDTYDEWSRHQYDPGHYLGGTIEPSLRASSMGPRAKGRAGWLLLLNGLLGVVVVAASPIEWTLGSAVASIAIPLLAFAAGWRMLSKQ